jgi:opacity protein-like surface antigen
MKRTFFSAALAVAFSLPAFADTAPATTDTTTAPAAPAPTDTAPAPVAPAPAPDSKDMKDMKDVKQIAPTIQQSDAGFYIAAFGGVNFDTWYGNDRQTLTTLGGSTVSSESNINSQWGGAGGVKIGYNFESTQAGFLLLQPAVELEGLYVGMDASSSANVFAPGNNERFSTNSGDVFINGILRFKTGSIVTPYIGLGVGGQYLTTHGQIAGPGGTVTGLDTSDFDFAAQGLLGIDVAITDHISLFTEYKFIEAVGTDAKNANVGAGSTYRFKPDQIQQNLITAGVKYTF